MSQPMESIQSLSAQIREGTLSSADLVRRCLTAVMETDQSGKRLNTVSELNPNCLFEAEAADLEIAAGKLRGPLHGIPVLVKDNIDVKELHTTAGSYALHDLIAQQDSPLAAKLKQAGAIILGKSNMSEFAYWMSSKDMPCGFSSLSGQVVHAYNPAFDPSGSSTGSAVAVSAGIVPGAIGTETCGSLTFPGIANAIVSLKPTVGLVSRSGIIPISHSQDTAGPMANSVWDCAALLEVMAGRDADDPATHRIPADMSRSYTSALNGELKGMRIGVYTDKAHPMPENAKPYQALLFKFIEAAGATAVPLSYEDTDLPCSDILTYEFRNGLNRYLASHQCSCRSLQDVIDFNIAHSERCLTHGQDLLEASNACSGMLKEAEYLSLRMEMDRRGKELITGRMDELQLDCLVTASNTITSFAAVYGSCSMVIPAAPFDPEIYRPVSYFLVGRPFGEHAMLRTAYALEQQLKQL